MPPAVWMLVTPRRWASSVAIRNVESSSSRVAIGVGPSTGNKGRPDLAIEQPHVGLDEPRQHGAAFCVDHDRLRTTQALDLARAADAKDLVALNRDRFGVGVFAVRGVETAVDHHQIDGAIVFALRADDETGDEGDADDDSDDVRRETSGHE